MVDSLETRDFDAATTTFVKCDPLAFVTSFGGASETSEKASTPNIDRWAEANEAEAALITSVEDASFVYTCTREGCFNQEIALDPTHPLAAFLDYWEALPLFATQAELPEATRSRVREERAANDPLALRANLSDAGQHKMDDLRPALARLNKPLLYIVGERDVAYTEIARDLMRTWADEHKDSLLCGTGFLQIEVMRDVGHNTHLEAPDQFAQVVRAFLMRTA